MQYKVNLAALDHSFQVPHSLADHFIKLANPKHILVLLWVLRHAQTPKSVQEIADQLHMDPAVVREAVFYWIDNGFIVPEAANNTTAKQAPPTAPQPPKAPAKQDTKAAPTDALSSSIADDADILARAKESPEFQFLLQKSQQIFGRTISKAERSMLLSLTDYYGLPPEVILMLIKYAVLSGRTGTNYIQTVGMNWAEEEIKTLEQAEAKIKQLNKTNRLWRAYCEQAGIAYKNPTKKQEALFVKWTKEWQISIEIIAYGYEKMIDAIDKVNYTYLDKMITSWHDAGTTTIDSIERAEQSRKEKKSRKKAEPETAPSFNIEQYNRFVDGYELNYQKEKKDA